VPSEVTEGSYTLVIEGTTLAASGWIQTQDITTVDTDNIIFEQFSGSTVYTAGNGIDISSFAISVKLNGSTLFEDGSGLKLADLTATHILVGSAAAVATDVAMSGDATIISDGTVTVVNQIRQANYIVRETPTGTPNGILVTFTLANTPVAGTEMIYLNGLLQDEGGGNDYTISTVTVTFNNAPQTGDKIRCTYTK
jgi:hypothetical protein